MEGIYYIWMEGRKEKTENGIKRTGKIKMNKIFIWYLQREDFWNTE